MKRIEKDGKFYRMRRGVLVEIPEKWLNKIPTKSTISDRKEKAELKRKARRRIRYRLNG